MFDDLPQFVCASIKELLMVASEPVDKDGTALQDCEICRTAISSTLLLVLKWFKVSRRSFHASFGCSCLTYFSLLTRCSKI